MRLASLSLLLFGLVVISAAQDTNFSVGPQYLLTGSPLLARPVATPTLSLDALLPPIADLPEIVPVIGNQPFIENPAIQNQADLFPIYYGHPMPAVVIIVSNEEPVELPASLTGPGVTGFTNAQSLREQGFGVPLGEASSFWKTHKRHASRVFTNADIDRLHRS